MILNEGCDCLARLALAFEACAPERLTRKQAEYDLDLVQLAGRSRCEVKLDTAPMLRQPVFVFLVGGVVVQDRMDFFVRGPIGEHAIEKAEKIFPLFVLGDPRLDLTGADFESGNRFSVPWRL